MSAVQLGELKRVSVFEITEAMITELDQTFIDALKMNVVPLTTLIDYTVTPRGEPTSILREGCLSIPRLSAFVERPLNVLVKGHDGDGNPVEFTAHGWFARLLQHEHDHLEGILYTDRMIPSSLAYAEELSSKEDFLNPPMV
jgi:peptide deformylase